MPVVRYAGEDASAGALRSGVRGARGRIGVGRLLSPPGPHDDSGCLGSVPASSGPSDRVAKLHDSSTWMYQLQDLEQPARVAALAESDYDLLMVEPGNTLRDGPADGAQLVHELRAKPAGGNRLVLAYIDIGEADDYRSYWQDTWRAPTAEQPGAPSFLITVDPDGWSGSYPVAYWDDRWRDIWLGAAGEVANLARLGFDGVYLDWVEAYDDPAVRAAAEGAGVDPRPR